MKKIVIATVLVFFATTIFAKNTPETPVPTATSISGIVKDTKIDKAVEYANIILFKQSDSTMITGAISDSTGIFVLQKVPYGKYYLVIYFIGYQKKVIENIEISKQNRQIDFGEISLEQATENIEEVVVRTEKNYIDYKIDKKIVNVSQQLSASGGTAVDVLENAPSVTVDIEGNVSIRGSESYTVLIDGKPTVMSGNDILKQIPASSIQHIEIITNPSAKYDPEGTAGIVNIVMKKENRDGFNGIVNANVATWDKFGGDLTLNYRKNKANFFVSENYNRTPFHANSVNDRKMFFTDTTNNLLEKTVRKRVMNPWKTTFGVDYDLTENDALTISGSVGGWNMDRIFETTYETWTVPQTTENYATTNNEFFIRGLYYSANGNYQHKIKNPEHKIDFMVNAWQWQGNVQENSLEQPTNQNFIANGEKNELRSNLDNLKNTVETKIDYSLPTKIGKFEMGANSKIAIGTSNFVFENFDNQTNEWQNNPLFTNEMEFRRNIYSAYTTFASKIVGFDYQLGMRLEYTDRLLYQKTTNEKYPMQIFNYYPTLHISRALPKNQQVQISYSRRINRPQDWNLNPFPGYTDSYNSFVGNPFLKPEDIDSYEFNYINQMKKLTLSAGIYYRIANNSQTMTLDVDADDPNKINMTFDNIDQTHNYGTELMANYRPTKFVNFNWSANVYRQKIDAELIGDDIDKALNSWNTRLTASLNLSKNTRIQLTGMYNSPVLQGQGTQDQMFFMMASARQDFLKKRLSVTLNARDVFATGIYHVYMENSNFSSDFVFKREAPIMRLSISYKINNYQRSKRQEIDLGEGGN